MGLLLLGILALACSASSGAADAKEQGTKLLDAAGTGKIAEVFSSQEHLPQSPRLCTGVTAANVGHPAGRGWPPIEKKALLAASWA